MDDKLLLVLILGLLPLYEPRYVYPVLSRSVEPVVALIASVLEAIFLSILLAYLSEEAWVLLEKLSTRYGFALTIKKRVIEARRKATRLVEKYGDIGLAVFVAVPLPVTGIYTGAVVAFLLGIPRPRTAMALAAGGVASVLIIAILTALGATLIGQN
ncbi:COG2426 family protein [Pyrofollis japonicus]|uniref:small multi-drug export protein n=1 Tax=Pyrofollis japonicus TaxID=3060460 RepID=UPI00295A64DC|nr:small multi-drug export protein [Pyrofollis japonicus]BEP18469.1 COG2426 family protein [Pyrofollis japonicus]